MRGPTLAATVVALAALSLLGPWAPGYDPLAWLIWGREVAHLDLDTTAGPAWKPLPVAVTAAAAPLGDAAAAVWVVVARAGALAALLAAGALAARVARTSLHCVTRSEAASGAPYSSLFQCVTSPSAVAAAGAVAVLAATDGFLRGAALGYSEPLLVALALGAAERHLAGRWGQALALGAAAGLLRPEVWPFLAVYGAWLAVRAPRLRLGVAAVAVALPALWFLPELWGSGDLLRSSGRARVPNPGAPALADRPGLASLEEAATLLALPLVFFALAGLAFAWRRRERLPLALGAAAVAWIVLVAAMAEVGYSGEARYLLPAAGPVAVLAGSGLALAAVRAPSPQLALAGASTVVLLTLALALPSARGDVRGVRYAAQLHRDLGAAVEQAGGARALRLCGAPAAGRYRFPSVAWRLGVHIADVRLEPSAPGVVFRSRLTRGSAVQPAAAAGFVPVVRAGTWEIRAACAETAAVR
jgi:hypothetical protein